jgi:2-oxoglutarate dehydrogenase E2 component (dihydrolipoamide succinyltransferase)
MPVEVRVPSLGESVIEATVGAWVKKPGDAVAAGEVLVQLETEKVNVEVSAERAGTLERIERREGDTVRPGDVLGSLADGAAAGATPAPPAPAAEETPHRISPQARRIAEEHGVSLEGVAGSGPGGRVMRGDVEKLVASPPAATLPPPAAAPPAVAAPPPPPETRAQPGGRSEERVRMSRRRQVIAQRLLEAQRTAAMLTTFNEVDMGAVMELRGRRRDAFKERHGVSLGFMSFFTAATVGALKAFPRLNAEIDGDEIVLKRYYDIGIAVGADEGLVVPVVRDADRKTFAEIEREIGRLAERARANQLTLDDLRGGTFTITNGGVYGSLLSTPILNPPQVGILGMHRIQERAMVKDGQIVARPMMYLALTYDHRIVDGREAVQFLVRVKELIEDPEALLLEG